MISARAVGDDVVVRVIDTGAGIPPEHLARVSLRSHRVDAARPRKGDGCGSRLAISPGSDSGRWRHPVDRKVREGGTVVTRTHPRSVAGGQKTAIELTKR
jgi:hypothetical protein